MGPHGASGPQRGPRWGVDIYRPGRDDTICYLLNINMNINININIIININGIFDILYK